MALRLPVKIGNVTNLSDARYGAGMGVDFLGFPVGTGIPIEKFRDIVGWVAGPEVVIELTDPTVGWLGDLPDLVYQIDVAGAAYVESLPRAQKWVISGTALALRQALPALLAVRDQILFLEVAAPAHVMKTDLTKLSAHFNIWAQITDVDSLRWVAQHGFSGIALHGITEERTGLKEYGALAEILEALETD